MPQQRRASGQRLCRFLLAAVLMALIPPGIASAGTPPKYNHIVIVILENHSFRQIASSPDARYLHSLAHNGAVFADSHGVAHPSQPNYLALFSGSTHGIHDDGIHDVAAPNLAARLRAAGKTFIGYVDRDSPRKHNPWESFADAKWAEASLASFPTNYPQLPAVSFVIPNLRHDMHDGTISQADIWLKANLSAYANWSRKHNSVLIITFDEDDYGFENQIYTVLYGAHIKPGRYAERIDHYTLLRTIEDIEGIRPLGATVVRKSIVSAWSTK